MERDSEGIESVNSDLVAASAQLVRLIALAERTLLGQDTGQTLACVEGLDECTSLMRDLEVLSVRQPPSHAHKWHARVTRYRKDIAKLREQVEQLTGDAAQFADKTNFKDERRRVKFEEQNLVLDLTSARILNAQKVAHESLEIGHSTLENLDSQHRQLENARSRLGDTGHELYRARQTLRAIWLSAVTNKALLCVIVLVELMIMGIVVYVRWFK